jgi:hypothetical protein
MISVADEGIQDLLKRILTHMTHTHTHTHTHAGYLESLVQKGYSATKWEPFGLAGHKRYAGACNAHSSGKDYTPNFICKHSEGK